MLINHKRNWIEMKQSNPATVVIIDDNEQILLTTDFLQQFGYHTIALQGIRDISVLAKANPSLVLFDLEMPLLTGKEILALIKENSQLSQVPVVVISGSMHLASKTTLNQADAVLEKPFSYIELLQIIQSLIPPSSTQNTNPQL